MNERWIGTMNERWIGTMNERWTIEWSNERSEFRQYNGRTKIIWTNKRMIERSDERTNKPWTIGRSDKQTNKLRTGGRTIEERSKDPCASVCLCGRWSGRGGGELPWNGLGGLRGGPCPSIYSYGGGIRGRDERISGRMRGLVGD
jgi:hypothetical protein